MALPTVKHPIFTLTIPSTQQKVSFRPYTVNEEKLIIIAADQIAKDFDFAIDNIIAALNECITDDVDLYDLPLFDLEYIIVKLRSKSVGEIVEIKRRFGTNPTDPIYTAVINLEEITVNANPEHSKKFLIHDDIGVVMRYPSIRDLKTFQELKQDNLDDQLLMIAKCIESVYDTNQVYTRPDDFDDQQATDLLRSLPNLDKFRQFFDSQPSIELETTFRSNNMQDRTVKLTGLASFL